MGRENISFLIHDMIAVKMTFENIKNVSMIPFIKNLNFDAFNTIICPPL